MKKSKIIAEIELLIEPLDWIYTDFDCTTEQNDDGEVFARYEFKTRKLYVAGYSLKITTIRDAQRIAQVFWNNEGLQIFKDIVQQKLEK